MYRTVRTVVLEVGYSTNEQPVTRFKKTNSIRLKAFSRFAEIKTRNISAAMEGGERMVSVNGVSSAVRQNVAERPALSMEKVQQASKEVDSVENEVSHDVIEGAAEAANKIANAFGANIKFEIDDETNIEVLQVIDADSGQVIKEMPPKAVVKMLGKLWETIGIFVDSKA